MFKNQINVFVSITSMTSLLNFRHKRYTSNYDFNAANLEKPKHSNCVLHIKWLRFDISNYLK